ncbi:uncharacterized protein PHALS_00192 [Plasmopara halstedii]|uniref:Uncharacterized protein n=1 Tax=Plasmopara halstedii TaxID=4781 RepID=A0A0P1A678_PLAHL|nr:uncharacterized protein PHALS_00192 [Plasmopara halstedii]CEG35863.1 hypothetical protein PHALS_00192 [Plasmopara halstedii]|eukprot:XP_024572232.1 hypothetical protein PHALS_00192 [Plasmopara halstedii]
MPPTALPTRPSTCGGTLLRARQAQITSAVSGGNTYELVGTRETNQQIKSSPDQSLSPAGI